MCLCAGLSSFFLLLPFYFLLRLGSQPEIQEFSLSSSTFSYFGGCHIINILSLFLHHRKSTTGVSHTVVLWVLLVWSSPTQHACRVATCMHPHCITTPLLAPGSFCVLCFNPLCMCIHLMLVLHISMASLNPERVLLLCVGLLHTCHLRLWHCYHCPPLTPAALWHVCSCRFLQHTQDVGETPMCVHVVDCVECV